MSRSFRRTVLCAVSVLLLTPCGLMAQAPSGGKARHVVLMVWDGLRPDSVTPENTPTLAKLAQDGVFFAHHHPVYPSSTEVNGTAMATGDYPAHSGLIANREYRSAIDPLKLIATETVPVIRKGDDVTGGKYLRAPTLPEILQAAGQRTIVTGTKPVVLLMDRAARPDLTADTAIDGISVTLFSGDTLPANFFKGRPSEGYAEFPKDVHFPNIDEDAWTTRALTSWLWPVWPHGIPAFSVLWMSDPDFTQHQFGPNSPEAHRALAGNDANLATVLKTLAAEKSLDSTDVFVVSDHGFSTIGRIIDTAKALTDAGFPAVREFKETPKTGDILVDSLGGSDYLYIAGHDTATIGRIVTFLQGTDFAGVIFTKAALPGTFALSAIHVDSPDAPDIAVALRWTDEKSATGFPGLITSDGGRRPGQGTHASLSRYDMHNTLIACGPDFRRGFRDESPSGNVDLAPTIARILGLTGAPKMDGRVLTEALQDDPAPKAASAATDRRAANAAAWSQYLQITRFGGVDYIDEANAGK